MPSTDRSDFARNCRWILYTGLLLIVAAVTLAAIYFGPMLAGVN